MSAFSRSHALPRSGAFTAVALGLGAALMAPASGSAQDQAAAIQRAIQRGAVALLPKIPARIKATDDDQPMGRLALPLAAVLKSGVSPEHPAVKAAFERLRALPLNATYSIACYVFALDAAWQATHLASRRERQRSKTTSVEVAPRIPPQGHPVRKELERCIARLVQGDGGRWNYQGRARGDLSNSQFAVLALEIGLQNEISIPVDVFRDVAEDFVVAHAAGTEEVRYAILYKSAGWEGVTEGTTRVVQSRALAGGWTYNGDAGSPSLNMTAAGVSSLLIARKALQDQEAFNGPLAEAVEEKLRAGLGWMSKRVRQYFGDFYGIYSLEKAADIGSIHSLDGVDWYDEGARYLLRLQRPDGSWGSEVDTSFALLFLTRATRSHVQTLGPPVVYTRSGGEGGPEADSDLVYIGSLDGFVSARTVFGFLRETRDPKVFGLVDEVLRGFPAHRLHEALEWLLGAWSETDDAVTKGVRSRLRSLLETRLVGRAEIERKISLLRKLRGLEQAGHADLEAIEEVLDGLEAPLMLRRTLDLVDRLGLVEALPRAIALLEHDDDAVRERARSTLAQWTGVDVLKEKGPPSGKGYSRQEYKDAAVSWRAWWSLHGTELARRRGVERLIRELEAAGSRQDAERAEAQLVALGREALPQILEAMERGEFSIHLVQALEAITGRAEGVRLGDWRKVLSGSRP